MDIGFKGFLVDLFFFTSHSTTFKLCQDLASSFWLEPLVPWRENELRHEKTINVVSEKVQHKPSCTSLENG